MRAGTLAATLGLGSWKGSWEGSWERSWEKFEKRKFFTSFLEAAVADRRVGCSECNIHIHEKVLDLLRGNNLDRAKYLVKYFILCMMYRLTGPTCVLPQASSLSS